MIPVNQKEDDRLDAFRYSAAVLPVLPDDFFDEPAGECRKSPASSSKPRMDLLPVVAIHEIAEVLTYGAKKYEDNNWARCPRWGRYVAALLRHVFAWMRGEDKDPETGFSHLAHAGCCVMFLLECQANGWGEDDRFKGPKEDEAFTKHDGVD